MEKKLKIVQVIPDLRKGGAERLVIDLSHSLVKKGHEVIIITFREANYYLEQSKGLDIRVIPSKVIYSFRKGGVSDTTNFDQEIKAIRPDIVHCHLIEADMVAMNNPVFHVKYISHWHGCPDIMNNFNLSYLFNIQAWGSFFAKQKLLLKYKAYGVHFISISRFITEYLRINMRISEKRITLIYNSINLKLFGPKKEYKKNKIFTLVSIGRFAKRKNQGFLVDVVNRMHLLGERNFKLIFLGEGEYLIKVKEKVIDLGLLEYIQFYGNVNNPEDFLRSSDVLVHSAYNEPFGLIFLEAMSSGIPIVAIQSGAVEELIKNNVNGYLIAPENVKDFTSCVLKLKKDLSLIKRLGRNGISEVERFDHSHFVDQVESLYLKKLES